MLEYRPRRGYIFVGSFGAGELEDDLYPFFMDGD
jgi:hypothetical protein